MLNEDVVIDFFGNAIADFAKEYSSVPDWLLNTDDNIVKAMEIESVIEEYKNVEMIGKKYRDNVFDIEIRVKGLESWKELDLCVKSIIIRVSEQFLLVQQVIDHDFFRYWFATGTFTGVAPHGHSGFISLRVEDIKHLNKYLFS